MGVLMKSKTFLALSLMMVTQAFVVVAAFTAPVLGKRFSENSGFPPEFIGYYTSVVFIGAMAMSLAAGPLVQRFGSLRISQATVLFAVCGLLLLLVEALAAVAISALLLGLAYGPGNPASSQLLSRTTSPAQRGMVFSIKQTAIPLGVTIAGLSMPYLAVTYGVDAAFTIGAIVGLVILIAVQPWRSELDQHRPERVSSLSIAGPFRTVFTVPALGRLAIVSACLASVQFAFSAIFVTFLQEQTGAAATAAGPVLSIAMAISVGLRIVLGVLADRFGGRAVLIAMSVAMFIPAWMIAALSDVSFLTLAILGVIMGSAAFSWNGVFLAEVAEAAPGDEVATATAGTMFFVFLGGFVGPGAVATATLLAGTYAAGLAVMGVFAVIGCAALAWPSSQTAAARSTDV